MVVLDEKLKEMKKGVQPKALGDTQRTEVKYIIDCRFSKATTENLPDRDLSKTLSEWVLFSYYFSAEERSVEDVKAIAAEAFEASKRELHRDGEPAFNIDLEDVVVEAGSILVTLLIGGVTAVATGAATPAAVPIVTAVAVGSGVIWVTDKFFGGAIERLGAKVSEIIMERFGQKKKESNFTNIAELAEMEATTIATKRGCKTALSSGGFLVDGWYRYLFQLTGCDSKSVTVEIQREGKEPPRVQVI